MAGRGQWQFRVREVFQYPAIDDARDKRAFFEERSLAVYGPERSKTMPFAIRNDEAGGC